MATIVEELVAVFGFDVDNRALARANQGVRRTEQRMERAAAASQRVGRGIQGMLVAWVGLDQAARQFGGLVEANAQMDDLTAAMTLATGSAESAESAMQWIADFSSRSPDQIQEVTEAFQMLQQQGLDPMDGRLVALGNTAAALQTPISELMNATAGAAIGNLERLERMLVRYGYSLTSTDGVVRGMASGEEFVIGEGFAAIEQFLVGLGEGRFASQMERRAETINGAMSMLRDAIFQFRTGIGDAEFNNALVALIGSLERLFRSSSGGATVIGRVLAGALNTAARSLAFVDTHLSLVMAGLAWLGGTVAISGLIALGSALASAGAAGMAAAAQIFAIPLALAGIAVLVALVAEDFYRFANGQESVIGRLAKRYPQIVDPLKDMIAFFRDLAEHGPAALRLIREDFDAITGAVDRLLDRLGLLGRILRLNPVFHAAAGGDLASYMENARGVTPDVDLPGMPEMSNGSNGERGFFGRLAAFANGSRTVTMGGAQFEHRPDAPSVQAPINLTVEVQGVVGEAPEGLGDRIGGRVVQSLQSNMDMMFRLLPGAT